MPEDLLHTSGTSSRPKAVPLSHSNLRASLANIAATYRMTGKDRWAVVCTPLRQHSTCLHLAKQA